MVEERGAYPGGRPRTASWTKLFGTFLVALDPFKLLVAAAGILVTALGWWFLSLVFYNAWSTPKEPNLEAIRTRLTKEKPNLAEEDRLREASEELVAAQAKYDKDLDTWALMHELAGPSDRPNELYARWYGRKFPATAATAGTLRNYRLVEGKGGRYRTMPWAENRGPNPFLFTRTVVSGTGAERGEALTWFASNQAPNLIEPLLKFLTPVFYLFENRANFWVRIYLLLLIVWFLAVWAFFGGVITRMAILQLAGKEGGGVKEAIAYVRTRYLSYLLSPLVPLGLIGFMVICCMLFGILHWIPGLGDLIDGLFWWLPLLAGLVMTLLLVGMVGYPMMYTTLSAEGSDTFDALSRSYNYVYESPWSYVWYAFVAIVYGAVLTLFVVTVGSLTVFFAKWGVSNFPTWGTDRSPEYLFIYSPESLGWRKLLVEGSPAAIDDRGHAVDQVAYDKYMDSYGWWNHMGAGLTSFWVTLVFLMVIGFGYSYFWTASSQIYLLMRKKVDETEMDEVYLEEEAPEVPASQTPVTPSPAPVPTPQAPVSVPVDAPTLKTPVAVQPDAPASLPTVPGQTPASPPSPTEPPVTEADDGKPTS
jgi:hypothetical protein